MAALPPHLEVIRSSIEQHARDYGLDFFEVIFECISADEMNMIAAYGGFPTRYPHWRFGMEYEQLQKSYRYGLGKIYELVINNDPCYAYLMTSNEDIDQKLVMAHVYGHCDFFKNNFSFQHTNRKFMNAIANHATKIRRYIDKYGPQKVEDFLDKILSIENLIDRQSPFIKRHAAIEPAVDRDLPPADVPQIQTNREYMEDYLNPQAYLNQQRERLAADLQKEEHFPKDPEKDILWFLIQYAPLKDWEKDCLTMIREEAYYFAPQAMTKIMNEGWACYWHTTILTQKALLDKEVIDYADRHAGTMAMQPGGLNPYKIGLELFRDIEDRWNKGRFGREYHNCDDLDAKRDWNTHANLGRAKIFEVRKHYNDVTFIDEFLTEDFVKEHQFFNYAYNKKHKSFEIASREFKAIKKKLLNQLTNMGQPLIAIVDGNFKNRGELLLKHQHDGIDLRQDYMKDTLKNIQVLWARPVGILTFIEGRECLVYFDGQNTHISASEQVEIFE